MLEMMSKIFDTFGASVFVPVVLFILALALKVKLAKAFRSALQAGIGLAGFSMLVGAYMPIIAPVVNKMVNNTNISLPVMDFGWQSAAVVAYSTRVGMIFLGIAIFLQVVLFIVRFTNIFMPSDLWNTYSFMLWGSMLYLITENLWLSLGLMVFMNLYILLFAEILEKRFATYYNYPNCTLTAPHHAETVPFYILINWIMNKISFNKIDINPKTLQKKLGFLGEPMTLGLIMGLLLGVLGNLYELNTLAAWGEITAVGIATAAIMAIFPRVASLFAGAFVSLTDASRKSFAKKGGGREWYLAINDAAGYGESATLITGTLMIPIMVLLCMTLPGNKTLIMMDLIAMPFCMIPIIAISNGNMFKSLIGVTLYFSICLYVWSWLAPVYSQVAAQVGVVVPAGLLITTTCFMPFNAMVFAVFLTGNPLLIGSAVAVYIAAYILFKKNRDKVHQYMETCNDLNISAVPPSVNQQAHPEE